MNFLRRIISSGFPHLFPAFILLLITLNSAGQTCTSDQFAKRYVVSGSGYGGTFDLLPGGGYIMSGSRNFKQTVIKTDASGNIAWSKIYDFAEITTYYEKSIIRRDHNGNFVSSMNGDVVALFDPDGNVLRMKQLKLPWQELYVEDIAVTDDNRKIILAHDESTNPDEGILLICLTPDMSTVLWSKHISGYNLFLSTLLVKGNKILIAGISPNDGVLMCFDVTNGALLQQQFYRVNNQRVALRKISPYDSGYLLRGQYTDPATGSDNVIIRLDLNFNVIRMYRPNGIFSNALVAINAEPDGSFYGAWATVGSFGHNRFYATQNDSIIWNRLSLASGLMPPAAIYKTNAGLLVYGSGTWNNVGVGNEWGLSISISDANGVFRNCSPTSASIQKVLLNHSQTAGTLISTDTSMITLVNVTPIVTNLPINPTTSCSAVSNCNNISVTGLLNVCSSAAELYTAHRNPGCLRPVQWQLTGGNASTQVFSDSTIAVNFLQTGIYTLIANMGTECAPISDTTYINVQPGPILDLGPSNMSLCAGNSFVLRAQSGFSSYLWQNGSAGTDFLVAGPGLYHVTVTNACGQTFRDSVTVTSGPAAAFSVGADRTICFGDTAHLAATSGFFNYAWGPGYYINTQSGPSVIVQPRVDTIYYARAEHNSGCLAFDTVSITLNNAVPISLGQDKSFCQGDSAVLNAGPGFLTYQWSNGGTAQQITVNAVGEYSVIGTDMNGCQSYDTLVVSDVWPKPVVNLNTQTFLCEGESRLLDAGVFASYLWQDGSTFATYNVTGIGEYHVIVTDHHSCSGSDTVSITMIHPGPTDFLPATTEICNYGNSTLQPVNSYISYSWNTGSTSPVISVSQPGVYWLTVKDNNQCNGTDTVIVTLKECLNGFYIPKAFTPDNNGRNDYFRPIIGGVVKQYQFTIYNRWGQVVFSTKELSKGWDGKLGGIAQDGNVYAWSCQYQIEGGEFKMEKGTFVLIR